MHSSILFFLASLALLPFRTLGSPTPTSTPLPPSQDPWYRAPANFASAEPGKILRVRHAPGNLTSIAGNCSATFNVLYRTTDSNNAPSWAVTTLYVPYRPSKSSNLVSYQYPYDSAWIDGSPSYIFPLFGVPSDIGLALGEGWYVSVPDYEGPKAAFTAGHQSGQATLDSIRAILSSDSPKKLQSTTRVTTWGYSGGAFATVWASFLQPAYFPDLESQLAGTAMGGLPVNFSVSISIINKSIWVEDTFSSLLGITAEKPKVREWLLSQLKSEGPYNRTGFLAAGHMQFPQLQATYGYQDICLYFKSGCAVFDAPILQNLLEKEAIIAAQTTVPKAPQFLYAAIQDEISPINLTDALVDRWCREGTDVLFERNTVGGHLAELTNGQANAINWLGDAFEGRVDNGCIVRNVTVGNDTSPL